MNRFSPSRFGSEVCIRDINRYVDHSLIVVSLELIRNIDDQIIICVVGNKQDLVSERRVSANDAEAYAMSISADYFETSALTHTGIDEVFNCIANKVTRLSDNKCQSFSFGDSLDTSLAEIWNNGTNHSDLKTNSNNAKDKSSKCCTI